MGSGPFAGSIRLVCFMLVCHQFFSIVLFWGACSMRSPYLASHASGQPSFEGKVKGDQRLLCGFVGLRGSVSICVLGVCSSLQEGLFCGIASICVDRRVCVDLCSGRVSSHCALLCLCLLGSLRVSWRAARHPVVSHSFLEGNFGDRHKERTKPLPDLFNLLPFVCFMSSSRIRRLEHEHCPFRRSGVMAVFGQTESPPIGDPLGTPMAFQHCRSIMRFYDTVDGGNPFRTTWKPWLKP